MFDLARPGDGCAHFRLGMTEPEIEDTSAERVAADVEERLERSLRRVEQLHVERDECRRGARTRVADEGSGSARVCRSNESLRSDVARRARDAQPKPRRVTLAVPGPRRVPRATQRRLDVFDAEPEPFAMRHTCEHRIDDEQCESDRVRDLHVAWDTSWLPALRSRTTASQPARIASL